MILNNRIIEDIKKVSGLQFDKAGDFALLAGHIFEKTKRTIGVTTLKRLFCYIKDDRKASDYTLNTIAMYLGYFSWDEYASSIKIESEWGFQDESIYIQAIDPGSRIRIQYLNRIVLFETIEFNGQNALKVITSENSSLLPEDILIVYRLQKGQILEAEDVIRGSQHGNYKTNGELTIIEILK